MKKKNFSWQYLLFSSTVFLSSFLLFQVQPIIGKYTLPWFGGSSSVWIISLLLFQILLLAGYIYSYGLSLFSIKKSIIFHVLLLVITNNVLITLFFNWPSPITPPKLWGTTQSSWPMLQVFITLLLSIGLPYFILSTTSVLLQKWISLHAPSKSPYKLYVYSNIGALLGLVSYPFLIEPLISLRSQGVFWFYFFIIYSILVVVCCFKTYSFHKIQPIQSIRYTYHVKTCITWLILTFFSSMLLSSFTSEMTQNIAPIPFLWLLPVIAYLLSFIMAFASERWHFPKFYSIACGFLLLVLICLHIVPGGVNLLIEIACYSLFLFSAFMVLHGKLFRIRPNANYLNFYYIIIALGSVLGSFSVAVLAPIIFNNYWELYIALFACCIIGSYILIKEKNIFQSTMFKKKYVQVGAYFGVILYFVLLIFFGYETYKKHYAYSAKYMRNFYGTLSIVEITKNNKRFILLNNGKILHGSQLKDQGNFPTSYYGKSSGIGIVLTKYKKQAMHVGVIGLGTGTLALYGRKGDFYRFFEINPQVIDLAHTYFTYLKNSSAKVTIVSGDARLSLEKEEKENKSKKYDILVLDAFTADSIPIHLLTKEAFQTYVKRLHTQGIIVVHISNKYLDLQPVLKQIASHFSLGILPIYDKGDNSITTSSTWVLLTRNTSFLQQIPVQTIDKKNAAVKKITLWTDDYSNLLQILR